MLALRTLRVQRKSIADSHFWSKSYTHAMPTDPTLAIQTQALSKHYGRNREIKALQA